MDARGRLRLFVAAVLLLVVTGAAGWLLVLSGACGEACGDAPEWPAVLASLAWLVAGVMALLLVATGRAATSEVTVASAAIEANRLTGERAADAASTGTPEARLGAFYAALDGLSIDEVRMLAVRPMDPDAHATARDEALEAARTSGRGGLVSESRERIVDWVGRSFGTTSYDPTFVALGWRHEPLRVEDRAALADTLADAALACIVRDRVDEAVADELTGPCAVLLAGGEPGAWPGPGEGSDPPGG